MRFCIAYSCGKDSTLALYRMMLEGHTPAALIVTVNEDAEKSWFHGLSPSILAQISASLGIPLIQCRCNGQNYASRLLAALRQAKAMGASACAFGDIDIADHRSWDEEICGKAGLEAVLPLWQQDRLCVTASFLDAGFKAMIKTVSKQFGMGPGFLGKTLDKNIVKQIMDLGLDPCGENGEYHTLCYDGPIFKTPVETTVLGVHESEHAYSLHLESRVSLKDQ